MGALYRLASVGGSNGHEERVLNEALRVTREVLGCIKPAIFLVEDGRDEMRRVADIAGDERPDWELSLDLLAGAVRAGPQAFADRDRFSMDWYYPVLGGVLLGEAGLARIEERWSTFVVEDLGARCVADRPWVTTAETCELVLSLDLLGLGGRANRLLEWIQHLRADDGSYWTGATFPDGTRWPVEQTTWSAAAVILAYDALCGTSDTGGFFRTAAGGARPLSEPVADSF